MSICFTYVLPILRKLEYGLTESIALGQEE
jgi:hypothetical protein